MVKPKEKTMKQVNAIPVAEIKGWQKTGDGNHALFGFADEDGHELVLALPKDLVPTLAKCAISANAMKPRSKDLSDAFVDALETNWFVLGEAPAMGEIVLTLFLPDNGHMTYRMPRSMAAQMLETLQAGLQGASMAPPRGTVRN
jgi:hypothetical protein